MPSTGTIVTSVLAASAISYLVYFDYQRRNSPDFRKKLKKSAKKHAKAQEQAKEAGRSELKDRIQSILAESKAENPIPEGLQEREQMFVQEVAKADELLNAGDELKSALAFYRALYVYPAPLDLLNIYDEKLTEPVLDILRLMIMLDPPPQLLSALGGAAGGPNAAAAAAAAAASAGAAGPSAPGAADVE